MFSRVKKETSSMKYVFTFLIWNKNEIICYYELNVESYVFVYFELVYNLCL